MNEEVIIEEIAIKSHEVFNKYEDLFIESIELNLNPRFIFINSCAQDSELEFFPEYQIMKEQIELFISYMSIVDINKGVAINQLGVLGFGESDYYSYSNKGEDIKLEDCKELTRAVDELLTSNFISGLTIPALEINKKKCIKI